ncbi:MAG: LysM peptidoglycan-binding domain-containing protein [Bryobacterales bacterium]|nr:LysM peptidoglycan-binding domain-containing protein [Bryobacterales bacterium]
MADLEQLKQKYQPALDTIQNRGVELTHLHLQDGKLFIGAIAGSEEIKNEVWNSIKQVDAGYGDLTADIRVDSSRAPAPANAVKTYTVQPGDTLSKISKQFYGSPNQYMKIFEANRNQLSDPDKIRAGQQLVIP